MRIAPRHERGHRRRPCRRPQARGPYEGPFRADLRRHLSPFKSVDFGGFEVSLSWNGQWAKTGAGFDVADNSNSDSDFDLQADQTLVL